MSNDGDTRERRRSPDPDTTNGAADVEEGEAPRVDEATKAPPADNGNNGGYGGGGDADQGGGGGGIDKGVKLYV
jgi:hypothetical protein